MLVTDYLKDAACRFPDKVAVADDKSSLTYRELWQESRAVASGLLSVPPGPVPLWLGREARSVAASQGAALSGHPYVPLDISMPPLRLAKLLGQMEAPAILTDEGHVRAVRDFITDHDMKGIEVLQYEGLLAQAPAELPALPVPSRDDILMILFTSGSTGMPKGVQVTHRMLREAVDWHTRFTCMDAGMVRGGLSPLCFSVGAYVDVYETLAAGGTLHLLPPAALLFPRELMPRLAELQVNTIFALPSLYRMVADMGGLAAEALPPLRTACFIGEAMPPDVLRSWRAAFPEADFYQHYGATEVTFAACWQVEDSLLASGKLPVGRPAHQQLKLLDEQGAPVSQGSQGELVVSGCISPGYIGGEAGGFRQDPVTGQRLFYTGDLAVQDESGLFYCIGRRDEQVKHMGYRIELGEIEAAAAGVEGIAAAACIYDKEKDDLVLCYEAAEALTPSELMLAMGEALPRYMWPTRLERRDSLPRTIGGKIDRPALRKELGLQ